MNVSKVSLDCLRGRCSCKPVCPFQLKYAMRRKANLSAKQDFFGEAPNIFVGKYGYPNLNVGFLNVEKYDSHDDPLLWAKEGYSISQIVDLRTQLINSQFKAQVTDVRKQTNRFLEMGKEIAMAEKPVDVEMHLEKKPHLSLNFGESVTPHGASVNIKKAEITSNPKIPLKAEKVVDDAGLRAADAMNSLHEKGIDEHYLTRLLSIGNLGLKAQRKIVPTRWSITAVDDSLGKQLISEIKEFPEADYLAFFGSHLGNYYLVLMFPDVWSYELFETYVGNPQSGTDKNMAPGTDYEPYAGRKEYADSTAGGYYAARLAVLEGLKSMKRQGSVLCLRFITDEYFAPLGVWVVREAARNAMKAKPLNFGSEGLMLEYARQIVQRRFGYDIGRLLGQSILLREMKKQMKLGAFFRS